MSVENHEITELVKDDQTPEGPEGITPDSHKELQDHDVLIRVLGRSNLAHCITFTRTD